MSIRELRPMLISQRGGLHHQLVDQRRGPGNLRFLWTPRTLRACFAILEFVIACEESCAVCAGRASHQLPVCQSWRLTLLLLLVLLPAHQLSPALKLQLWLFFLPAFFLHFKPLRSNHLVSLLCGWLRVQHAWFHLLVLRILFAIPWLSPGFLVCAPQQIYFLCIWVLLLIFLLPLHCLLLDILLDLQLLVWYNVHFLGLLQVLVFRISLL
mmetsp:Transcript_22095/g.51115  ORF Transcript_22095/g.51115 Transcript_22095/m.51115 type:complete len:211 (+) Transcript_22095:444-1076(+)